MRTRYDVTAYVDIWMGVDRVRMTKAMMVASFAKKVLLNEFDGWDYKMEFEKSSGEYFLLITFDTSFEERKGEGRDFYKELERAFMSEYEDFVHADYNCNRIYDGEDDWDTYYLPEYDEADYSYAE